MKKTFYTLAAFCLMLPMTSLSQKTESGSTNSISKKVEIIEENGTKTVKVETTENGNTTTEIYSGDAADEFLKKEHGSHFGNKQDHIIHMDFDMDTLNHSFEFNIGDENFSFSRFGLDSIMKSFDFNFDFNGEMNEEMKKMMEELKNMPLHMENFQWTDSLSNTIGKNNKMIIIDDAELDEKTKEELKKMGIDIDTEIKDGKKVTSKVIVARMVLIEDVEPEKKTKVLDDVNIGFYPNPGNGDFTLEFNIEEEKDEAIISIHDMTGKIVFTETVKGKGNYKKQISLDEPSGIYILKIQQGKKAITKKLVIQ